MTVGMILLVFVLAFLGTAILGLVSKWIDRKVTGLVQWRVGPPWFQPFADFFKLLGKETIVPEGARRTGFLLAPLVGLAGVSVAAANLWLVNLMPGSSYVGDMIVVLYLLTLPSLALILGGSMSGNPHGGVGASREMKLLLSYELPLVLAMLAAVVARGFTFDFKTLMEAPAATGWGSVGILLGFLISLFCIQAKLGLVPFDQAEAECEIMGGVFVEYSGAPLAVIYLTRAMMLATLPIFLITIFWGGLRFDGLNLLWTPLKYVVIIVFTVLVRNTNPRVRIDQAMKFFWYGLAPAALVAVVLALAR